MIFIVIVFMLHELVGVRLPFPPCVRMSLQVLMQFRMARHKLGIINQLWITTQLFFQLRILIEIVVGVRQRVRAIVRTMTPSVLLVFAAHKTSRMFFEVLSYPGMV